MAGGQGLDREHVEAGVPDVAAAQRVDERVLVDEGAACGVHETRTVA